MIEIIILMASIPTGFFISYLARDELEQGRIWFLILAITGFLAALISFILKNYVVMLSSLFIIIVSGISYLKSLKINTKKLNKIFVKKL